MATETEHKFLLNKLPQMADFPQGIVPSFSSINQVYLIPQEPGLVDRVRRRWYRPHRGRSGRVVCHHTTKRPLGRGTSEELEKPTTATRIKELIVERADPACEPVVKDRGVFEWNDLTWEFDEFTNGLQMLEVEVPELRSDLELPPFLDMGPEVTGDARYSNAVIARKTWRNGFRNRQAFLAALRAAVAVALRVEGLSMVDHEVFHNEAWMISEDGETFLRFRDRCESPAHDFMLSCMVVRGRQQQGAELFWAEEQRGRSMPELADTIVKTICRGCSDALWWP